MRREHVTSTCVVSVVRFRQNLFTQSEYKSLNFASRVKIPIIKIEL